MTTYRYELLSNAVTLQQLSGIENKNLDSIEKHYNVMLSLVDNQIIIKGTEDDVIKTRLFIETLVTISEKYRNIDDAELEYLYTIVDNNHVTKFLEAMDEILTRNYSGKPIRAKTLGQKHMIDLIKSKDLTFAIGPAGTGKTYLAVAYAAELLKKNEIQRIILTRPAVEAGENLGFLPGDLKEKVDPYLRPLYDALDDMFSAPRTQRYIEKGVIEIAPLAYMRGRTLDDALIILDEAQNTTKAQMMMFLSRLGRNSKMIVTGDIDQIDLPRSQASGLKVAKEYLMDVSEIGFASLSHADVVRHPLVIKILKKFAEGDKQK